MYQFMKFCIVYYKFNSRNNNPRYFTDTCRRHIWYLPVCAFYAVPNIQTIVSESKCVMKRLAY